MLEQLLPEVSVMCLAELKKRQYSRKILWPSSDGVLIFRIIHFIVLPVCLKLSLQCPGAVNSLFWSSLPRLVSSH